MKTVGKFLFWLGLCLTIFILCDSCSYRTNRHRVGDRIAYYHLDTVTIIKVEKERYKVRKTRKNGTWYEYHIPKKNP